jgi:hypothetical protein
MVYTWGNSTKGKLGISNSLSSLKAHPQFFSEAKSIQAQFDLDEDDQEGAPEGERKEVIFTPNP